MAFRAGRPVLVGLALGSLAFKPQLGAFALAAIVLWPSWRLMAGLAVGCGLQLALVVMLLGTTPLRDYLGVLERLAASAGQFEPKIWAMHSLRGAFELLLGQNRLATACWAAGCGGCRVARTARLASSSIAQDVRFALICVVGLLLEPSPLHLRPRADGRARWRALRRGWSSAGTRRMRSVQYLVYGLVWLPLLGPLAAITHVQLTSPALVALLWHDWALSGAQPTHAASA